MKLPRQLYEIISSKTISVCIFICFLPFQSITQSTTFSDFQEVHLEVKGEKFNTFFSIAQDHDGYLWYGTNNGLVRSDGYNSKVYRNDVNDSTSIGGNQILDLGDNPILLLYVDNEGDLWAGTTNDLSRYDRHCDCFNHYKFPFANGRINAITEDKNNNIWVGGHGEGLFKYDRENDQFIPFLNDRNNVNSIGQDFVNVLLTDQNNNIWIGLWNNDISTGGLIRFNPGTGSTHRFLNELNNSKSLKDNRISSLLQDQEGKIWVGTVQNGLHQYDTKKNEFIRISPDPERSDYFRAPSSVVNNDLQSWAVNILHQNLKGSLWLSSVDMGLNPRDPIRTQTVDATVYHITGVGLNHFDPVKGRLNNYDLSKMRKVPTTMFEDRQGILWLGHQRSGGLYKMDDYSRKFKVYPELKGIQRSCESQLNPGVFWISTLNDGLHRLDTDSNTITSFLHDNDDEHSIGHNSVRATYEDQDGIVWIGLGTGGNYGGENGKGGLDRFDPETGIFKHFRVLRDDTSNFSLTIYSILEGHDDFLWMDTGAESLLRFDKSIETFKEYHLPTATKDSKVWSIGENSVKIFGAVDFTHGVLYQYNQEEDTFISFLDECHANAVAEDEEGGFWVATWGEGLMHYNPQDGSKEVFSTKDGLINNLVAGIIAGEDGIYWLATRVGLAKFDSKTNQFTSDGLPQDHFHIANIKASDGQFLFGGNNSLYAFYPDQVDGNPFPPKTFISGLQINGVPYNLDKEKLEEINLHYNQNDLSFEYTAIHNSKPAKNKYQYKLTPYDRNWVDATYQQKARYASLGPGDYTFQVKAANSDGVWNKEDVSLSFIIAPPWWQTWWAITLMALLIFGIVFSLFRFQLFLKIEHQEANRLKELDTFKTRFYANITHDFRTPLTVIEGMANELENNPNKASKKNLSLIKKNSKILLALVNQMLDLSKLKSGKVAADLQHDDILLFIKYLVETNASYANLKNVGLQFYSDQKEIWTDFDVQKLEQILTNLISNALKFTAEYGKVLVVAKKIKSINQTWLELIVKDNGIGISPEQLPYVFDRFHQANPTHANKGTGIGLAIVKELVTILNGTIEVESELSKGTSVVLHFPIQNNAPLATRVDGKHVKELVHQANFSDGEAIVANDELPILLIIEDNNDVVYYLKTCLEADYQITTSRNGMDGVEKALQDLPDIIISDVMMPEMDGFEVCKRLKEDERSSHIPIILLTAKATSKDRILGLTYGADAYLTKPFEKAELLVRLNKLLEIRKTLQIKYRSALISAMSQKIGNETREDSFVQKIEKIVLSNLDNEDFSIHELARELHLSRSQVYRKIKALTGMSVVIYIRHIRLQKAKELLDSSDFSISEIAYKVGFKTPMYFSQVFKETFGNSPSSTRK